MKTTALLKTFVSVLLVFTAMVFADTENKVEHDNHRISIFAQPGISFLSFEEREYFQNAIDTIYREFYSQALTESESLTVAKQDFQKVNFCFPITGGLQFQPFRDHFFSLGLTFIYDHESVVLTDRRNKSHNYDYTIQGMPLFLEYRLAIPKNLMSLTGESLFSVAVRWYWILPGTEIYTSWGKIEAETPIYGGGFGVSIGYLLASWHGINIFGDIGYTSIPVKSNGTFHDIVPDGPEEKAKWDIGGLQMQFRVSFGFWDYPKIEEDSTKTQKKGKSVSPLKNRAVKGEKSAKADSTKSDSAKVDTSKVLKQDSTKVDTNKVAKQDSAKVDSTKDNTSKAVKQDSAKVDTSKVAKPDSTKADTSKAVKQDSAKTDTSKVAKPDSTKADTSKAVKQDSAKVNSSKAAEPAKPATEPSKTAEPAKPAAEPAKKDEPQRPAAKKATGP